MSQISARLWIVQGYVTNSGGYEFVMHRPFGMGDVYHRLSFLEYERVKVDRRDIAEQFLRETLASAGVSLRQDNLWFAGESHTVTCGSVWVFAESRGGVLRL